MSKRRKHSRMRMQQDNKPMPLAGWLFWAIVSLSPFGAVWIGARHYSILLGPKNYREIGILVGLALCMLGNALLAYQLSDKLKEQQNRLRGMVSVVSRACLYMAAVIGPAALVVAIPDRNGSGFQFSRFSWGLGLFVGLWVLGAAIFGKSKNPFARFFFTLPDPKPRPRWWPWPLRWWG